MLLACKSAEKPTPAAEKSTPVKTVPHVQVTRNQLYPFMTADGNKWGFLDMTGAVVVEPEFQWAAMISEGMARVKKNDLWGYVDANGNTLVEPKYERARNFEGGHGAVRLNGKYGYLDRTGTLVVQPKYSKLTGNVSEGLIAVPDENKNFGYISLNGDVVIPHKFDNAHAFSEGWAAVEQDKKWGFIDKSGNWAIPAQYVWADKFVDGIALVREGVQPNVRYAMINRNNDILYTYQTLHVGTPSDGLIRFEAGGKWGFWDRTGKWVIPPTYDAAFDFSEGLAAVRIGNGWGYIDAANNLVINIEHNVAEEFHGGLARVTWPDGKWGYIDQTARIIWQSEIPGRPGGGGDDNETDS